MEKRSYKIRFYALIALGIFVIILDFSRFIWDIDIFKDLKDKYIPTLSLPVKLTILLIGAFVIIYLAKGFSGYIKSLK